mgnify:CR=1 FL=1|jgi:hypothetical protein
MRYKNNVLDKLVQTEAIANRIQLQVNRSIPQDQIIESVEQLKESIEKIREIVSIEQDEFANQFAGR